MQRFRSESESSLCISYAAESCGILHQITGDRAALTEALKAYRTARDAWVSMAGDAKKVDATDITYGKNANMRGHGFDRISGINDDLAGIEARVADTNPITPLSKVDRADARRAIGRRWHDPTD
jgi:hypothetical protein